MNISIANPSPLGTIPPSRIRSTSSNSSKTESDTSDQERQTIRQLKSRDQVVRAHEAAHVAAGGSLVRGGANFSFQRGPDGVQYAIGGEVSIDTSKVNGDPQASLRKAEQIRAAALAPAEPSSQDRAVAAKAAKMAIEARAEINNQRNSESEGKAKSPFIFQSNESIAGDNLDLTA